MKPPEERPKFRVIMYVLGPISFAIWALNTGDTLLARVAAIDQKVVLVDRTLAVVILVFGALLIPLVDIAWDYWRAQKEQGTAAQPGRA